MFRHLHMLLKFAVCVALALGARGAHASAPADSVRADGAFCMGVRTNLLYDAVATPNIGVEFSVGRGFSIGLEGLYAWWRRSDGSRSWCVESASLSARKYFGRSALGGWHVGIYGELLRYDFCLSGSGTLSGGSGTKGRPTVSAGIEAGYSLGLSKRLRLDFAVGVGYVTGESQTYRHIDGHNVWRSTRTRHYYGPTRAAVSLVWVIGKGGRR